MPTPYQFTEANADQPNQQTSIVAAGEEILDQWDQLVVRRRVGNAPLQTVGLEV